MANYKQVRINLKPEDFEIIEKESQLLGISKSEWIRQKINLKIDEPRQPQIKKETKSVDPKVLYELKKIGNNINQITKYSNIQKVLDRSVLVQLIKIEHDIKKIFL